MLISLQQKKNDLNNKKKFILDSDKIAFDLKHRNTIKFNISKYNNAVDKGKTQYLNISKAKDRVSSLKREVLLNLDKHLLEFEQKFTSNGGKVFWASDSKEATDYIVDILEKNKVKLIVKSKSMVTEEIEINHVLEKHNIESVETDLGEFIVQVAGEKPYHIVTPCMHKSKEDVAKLFHEKFKTPEHSSPEELTAWVRDYLREKFVSAQAGITGANFIVSDVGGIALTENEGNAFLTFSFPKIHIVVVGIEKIIPSIKDFDIVWPLLATHGTGQKVTAYNSIITGPRKADEIDGSEEMHVILLDNGRTNLFKQKDHWEALSCIRCGACLNGCPVYRTIGGYTYNTVYQGPIGSVISPYLADFDENYHLAFASTLCRKCSEVCPVQIDLPELLLKTRKISIERKKYTSMEKISISSWKNFMLNPKMLSIAPVGLKNIFVPIMMKKLWGSKRKFPRFAKKSFRQSYK